MDTENQTSCVNKADALDILDRTIDFIRNCDNKASIFLGTFGVILTIVLTTEGISNLISIISTATTQTNLGSKLYLPALAVFIIITIFGLSQIIKVLGVTIDSSAKEGLDRDSKIFFEHIQESNYSDYKEKLLCMTDETFLNDVISQIYINSCICHDKYKNYKCGLKWTLIGFCGFSILWIIGAVFFGGIL